MASLVSELGSRLFVADADLFFLVQPAPVQLELANGGRLQRLFLARLVEYSQDLFAGAGPEHFDRHGCGFGQEIRFSHLASGEPAVRGAGSGYAVAGADSFAFYVVADALHFQDRFTVGLFTLSLFSGAFISEIIRGGIESVGTSQLESARAIGLTKFQTYRFVIFPQAIRVILPALAGMFANLIKDSSLAIRDFDRGIHLERAAGFRFDVQ